MSRKNLVIVESPKKAEKIEKFLGSDFLVKSSYGHIRDLAKKNLGVDIKGGFNPIYEVPSDKRKVIDELSKLASQAESVWLASDEDREGEAIAWHLTEVLGLPVDKTKRIVFHEITKRALLDAIENPRTVNVDLVNAQQARRVLDRLVGFELSPVLWKKVRPQLSAGRVQSVAVRLLVEREREIISFNSTPYWRVVALFNKQGDSHTFKAEISKRFESEAEATKMLEDSIGASFTVSKVEQKPVQKRAAAPFTTSTLQQEAGRKLSMSVSQTMSIAQKLYEHGLITYMRTDSVNLSTFAIEQCKEQIVALFGAEYSTPHNYKTKSKGAQEAHEAIRPSYIERREIEGTAAEKRLYDLIWKRTVASQMTPAQLNRTTITIERGVTPATFVATGEVMQFQGFMKLYTKSAEEDTADGSGASESVSDELLPNLAQGEEVAMDEISATERYTHAPARFDEPLLIKRLDELGIGRPSTYESIFRTIINRGYVLKQNRDAVKREYTKYTLKGGKISSKRLSENVGKEKNRLAPTDIGMMVNDYLSQQFNSILDYNFTANIEKEFDRIAQGEIEWQDMIKDFYTPFHQAVDSAVETQHSGNNGERILGVDPATNLEVKARIGRYGPMVEMAAETEEGKPKYAALKKGQLIESITLEEAISLFALPRSLGQYEEDELVVGIGKFGPYIRQGKSFTSLGKEEDPYTVSLERAIEIIEQQRANKASANTPLKTFEEDSDLIVKRGMYGPYIAYKGKNYRIPKSKNAEEITFEECQKIISSSKK